MGNFQLDKYLWKPKFANKRKMELKIPNCIPQEHSKNLTFILLTDIISRHFPVNTSFFILQYLKLAEYPWQPNFSNHT